MSMRVPTTRVIHQMCISDLSHLENERHCLSLQCTRNDQIFLYESCGIYLTPICRFTMNYVPGKFKTSRPLTDS